MKDKAKSPPADFPQAENNELASSMLPTCFGDMHIKIYRNNSGAESLAIISGELDQLNVLPVRVHSACFTAEVLGSLKCDCKSQLDYALQYIADRSGMVIYLPQEGRGVGLVNKIKAYALQDRGLDTVDANRALGLPDDARNYSDAAMILGDLGVQKIRLLTNNPLKVSELKGLGVDVVERVPMPLMANKHSLGYLKTKQAKMGHLYEISDEANPIQPSLNGKSRPIVHVNFALDQHGNTTTASGHAKEISCAKDWRRVHELREHYSAVVVGARTWLVDQPRLTARRKHLGREPRRQPERVIFAGRQPCHFEPDERRTFVIGTAEACGDAIRIETRKHELSGPLKKLRGLGINSMLVEGGLSLLHSFMAEETIDQLTIYVRTQSPEQAARAIRTALPELPQKHLQFEHFGDGILASGEDMFKA